MTKKPPALLCILGLLALATGRLVLGATIYYVDQAATGADSGTSWTDAYTNLQSALAVAWTNDQVWVAAGTYYPTNGTDRNATFKLRKQVFLYGGFTNGGSMADRNWTSNPTVLSGEIGLPSVTDNCYHVVMATNTYETIDGFTIRDGYSTDSSGGGLRCYPSVPSNIVNCTFLNNWALNGGGLYLGPSPAATWRVLVSNCLFVGNHQAGSGSGGGLCVVGNSSPIITHCGFYRNQARSSGGGLYVDLSVAAGVCDINACRFVGNWTDWVAGYQGGAAHFRNGNCIIKNTLVAANASVWGAGVYAQSTTNVQMESCLLLGNYGSTSLGGGVYIAANATMYINNSILWENQTGNTMSGNGGGVIYIAVNGTAYVGYTCLQGGLVWPVVTNNGTLYDQGGIITNNPLFATNLYSGTWTANAVYSSNTVQTVLTDTGATWPVNGLVGCLVSRYTTENWRNAPSVFDIAANSATTLTVWGDASAWTTGYGYFINDFHLRSHGGRWFVNGWTNDPLGVDSPCIDTGDPASAYAREPRPNGRRINMGMDGNTEEASKTFIPGGVIFNFH